MLSSPDDDPAHPYMFARVVGILHVNVSYGNKVKHQRMDVLWIRWFGHDYKHKSRVKHKRMPRIGFVPDDQDPFAFINPSDVIRAVHLIPGFKYGRTDIYLGPSVTRIPSADTCRPTDDEDEDWVYYYVDVWAMSSSTHQLALTRLYSSFADRDMWVRFCGEAAVGHHTNRHSNGPQPLVSENLAEPGVQDSEATLAQELAAACEASAPQRPEGDPDDIEVDEEDEDDVSEEEPGSENKEDVEVLDEREFGPEDGKVFADEDEDLPW
jgi:hypothetical protein